MALSAPSLFLYGYNVSVTNQNLDFQAVSAGPVLTAIIPLGEYSLATLLSAIVAAMAAADTTSGSVYTAVADRTIMGGTQNRVSIGTSGTFLSLLFFSGPNATTSISETIGFNAQDSTGGTTYTGVQTTGTALVSTYNGYNYADPKQQAMLQGASNISASGLKEAVVFNTQYFIDVEFKYEPKINLDAWAALRDWMISQAPFDFTPEITNPTVFYPVTLEKSNYGKNGMGLLMKEMLPDFPNEYTTGALNFRVVLQYSATTFIS